MNDLRMLLTAADGLRYANARTDSGDKAAWTAMDIEHLAASIAAEEYSVGLCPQCTGTVLPSTSCTIAKHINSVGKECTASGLPFYVAVPS